MTTGTGASPARSVRPAGRRRSTLSSVACSVLLAAGLVSLDTGPATAATPGLRGDFNGDGHGDVVAASDGGAGRITVLYGAAGGLGSQRAVLDQESPGVPGHDEDGDGFGRALAAADFDGDGFSDLAVGIPYEVVGTSRWAAGAVTILWGGPSGLSGGTPLPTGAPDPEGPYSAVGATLAAADFTGDGHPDLAVGHEGGVRLLAGPFTRAGANSGVTVHRLPAGSEWIDAVRAADMDGDGRADLLAEANPQPENDADTSSGIWWFAGAPDGLAAGKLVPGLPDGVRVAGRKAYTAGDLDGDGRADLAVASRGESGGGIGGRVMVVYGAAAGPGTGRPARSVDQDTEGVPGTSEPEDTFGGALAIGDVDGDHVGDLVVGAPGETLGSGAAAVRSAGAVTVLRGSPDGLTTAGAQMYTQDSPGVPGAAEPGDRFGAALLLTDTDHDSRADLAVTAAGENGTGMVWRLPGSPAGPTGTGSAYYGAPAAPAVRFGVPLEG
ncbi:VCBS repeat-containing protein [Streptomyces endophytica]|uniref:VCBS repeat-containing protein n=1 Tax=Streptomyces endophytica TaxID=2991496 RepID=A0ABY6PI40_9ACTN|nr:FG-GAP-like repeat-containing protein [Streptomyces endophytica]UZJ32827.1 VCBS repeat-containing protein [Streptomyces endophytica]